MKAMFLTMVVILSTSIASASPAVVQLTNRLTTVVNTAAKGTRVNTASVSRYAAAGSLINVSGANLVTLTSFVEQAEAAADTIAADNNDNLNGLPKAKRFEAIILAYASLVKNFTEGSGDANLVRIVTGELYSRAIAPKVNSMDVSLYDKFISFMKLYAEEGKSAEDASRDATGGSLREFANACGASVRR